MKNSLKYVLLATVARSLSVAGLAAAAMTTTTAPVFAQVADTGRIEGTVSEAERALNLRGALVEIPALNISTTTDAEGRFTMRRVPVGTYDLVVSYVGRNSRTETVTVEAGESEVVAVTLAAAMDVIMVIGTPIADSEAAALSRQRAADNVSNIIASDSIGRFPDRNAADALGRVPGISIERDQGQARFVNVRGAPAEFSTIAFNGVSAPTPSDGNRLARFDTIPNDIVGSIEVVKAITPDLPADSIGGFINIETQGAFDQEGFNLNAEIASGINELGGGEQFNSQVTASNTFFDGRLGVLASASFYHNNKVTDNTENRFEDVDGTIFSRQADYRIYRLHRQNTSANLRFDFRPNDNHSFYWNTIFSEFSDFEQRDQHVYDFDDAEFGDIDDTGPTGGLAIGNTPTRGVIYGVELDATFNMREDIEHIFTTQLGGESDFGGFRLEWAAGLNRSESLRDPNNAYWEYDIDNGEDGISVTYDYSDPDKPIVDVYETVFDSDTGQFSLGAQLAGPPVGDFVFENLEVSETEGLVEEYFGQFDIDYAWSPFGVTSDLRFGGKISLANATLQDTDIEITADVEAFGVNTDYSRILTGRLSRATFPQPALFEFGQTESFAGRDELLAAAAANNLIQTQGNIWENFYDVQEDIYAAYVMNTFRFNNFDIIVGARVEATEWEAVGNQVLEDNEGELEDILEAGSSRGFTFAEVLALTNDQGEPLVNQITATDDYVDFFPAVHFNYRPRENLVFRLAYTESIQRPGYSQIAPNQIIGDDSDLDADGTVFISGGNPDLEPFRARNFDAYAEYYLPHRGIVSLGFFHKQIDDPIFGATQSVDGAAFGFPDNDVRLSGPANGSDGEITGFEFNYSQQFGFLPEPWDGFGASINYTQAEDSARTPAQFNPETGLNDGLSRESGLSGASDQTYNISIFFEKYGISTRLTYQYRSEWLNAVDLSDERLDRFWDARPSLDYSFRFSMNERVTFFLDANNLTDEYGRRFNGDRTRVYEVERFGRSFLGGVRLSL